MNSELHSFIKEALEKGKSRSSIADALVFAGWQEGAVNKAMSFFADIDFPVPVPRPRPYLAAREAFLYLVSFITLYVSAYSFGSLLFSFINRWFPDVLQYQYGAFDVPRYAIASLIIAFPIFFLITRSVKKGAKEDPERKDSRMRKWLTYATLVIAAGVLIGDSIAVLSGLLGGELTIRFLLKALTVFGIAGAIFGFYLSDLQKEEKDK
ncbi:MAG: hypothetical protein HY482_00680 [Candidatus Wildermuthbacteria bacterium]|nr:hypothetical protein [Candidatus Wildermuthbacteria bacterium]